MIWNLILALIPVGLSILFLRRNDQPKSTVGTVLFFAQLTAILLFLPNAPYVATDLIHFLEHVRTSDLSLWKLLGTEFPIYAGFVLFGLVCYSFVADRILYALAQRFGKSAYRLGLLMIPTLCSIGVYLGRVARFNSWDILRSPIDIARSSRTAIENVVMLKVILGMTILLMIIHQVYKIFHDGLKVRTSKWGLKSSRFSFLAHAPSAIREEI